ncbi:acid sphingomyelinase-like phosphodiesterase 3b [Drosophila elegans]|uniref:acid sphingomyelinase-like phosphodiesterase 3b n=1 Tax=Drosophila elegans TaxID=30023 RepID=UPI0007E660C2|nr:acid sphingomyelinase-like phosphodiesterase 3b [Drosophila elegans]XP_017133892.1 acid sphingomyelinase-like phosphodiesterase 3b [Drosophila elegans]XP_017133893.1 acid sphingomyelinase-like phosphodiesterase 3b [Drosophila elegans]XP_017133894.1 acid sphingomyelinase-like phosphodiesterase 3b [Drosophila elegans]XP_017133895.1 acid sphingomyelinase-like phosphodiesterase 3b [Drosophila elegans]
MPLLAPFSWIWLCHWLLAYSSLAQARVGYFWHISDLHLDTLYSTRGDIYRSCWQLARSVSGSGGNNAATEAPGTFGHYNCDSPWSLIESAVKTMKAKQGDNVEFVLWTGDALSHSAQPLSEQKQHEILQNITDLLRRSFSSQFIFPVLGHEDGSGSYRRLGELWRHWLPSEALVTFDQGGYYSIEQTKSRLRIVALNTNFMRLESDPDSRTSHSLRWSSEYYTEPKASVSSISAEDELLAEQQWLWLEEVLTKSKEKQETVYIVGHMPPGVDERHLGPRHSQVTFTERNNQRYLEMVRKFAPVIQGQFFGHLHSDTFRLIYDAKGIPISWLMIAPSIAPRKAGIGSSNNPALRLYKFDTGSGQVLDYTQFWLDLTQANRADEPTWVLEYNLTQYYGLTEISAGALNQFAERFTGTDPSWFFRYQRANTVRYQTGSDCSGRCMLNHYCAITRLDYDEFRVCLEKEQLALLGHAPTARAPTSWSLLLGVLGAFYGLHTGWGAGRCNNCHIQRI